MKNNIFTFPGHELLMVKTATGFENYSNFVNPLLDNEIIGTGGGPVYLPPVFPDWNTLSCDEILAFVEKYRRLANDFNTPYPHIALYNDQIVLGKRTWENKCGESPIKIDPTPLPIVPVFPDFNNMMCDALRAEIQSYNDLLVKGKLTSELSSAYNSAIQNATTVYNKKCGASAATSPTPVTTTPASSVLPAYLGGFGGGSGGGGSTAGATKKKFNWWWLVAGAVVVYIATSGKEKKAA